jgi:GGDEF domain-containing protein
MRAAARGARRALAASEPAALVYAIPHDIALVADGLGPAAAETLLDLIGRRLAGLAGPRDSVARTADDAFVLMFRDLAGDALIAAEEAAERVLDALNAPFSVNGAELALDASVGVSVHPHHGATDRAALPRRRPRPPRGAGRRRRRRAAPRRPPDPFERLTAAARLRRAIERDELDPALAGHPPCQRPPRDGAEALVRWQHPSRPDLPGRLRPAGRAHGHHRGAGRLGHARRLPPGRRLGEPRPHAEDRQ